MNRYIQINFKKIKGLILSIVFSDQEIIDILLDSYFCGNSSNITLVDFYSGAYGFSCLSMKCRWFERKFYFDPRPALFREIKRLGIQIRR